MRKWLFFAIHVRKSMVRNIQHRFFDSLSCRNRIEKHDEFVTMNALLATASWTIECFYTENILFTKLTIVFLWKHFQNCHLIPERIPWYLPQQVTEFNYIILIFEYIFTLYWHLNLFPKLINILSVNYVSH